MDPKIAILFVLIGSIVALSHLNDSTLRRMRRQGSMREWRDIVPGWRKS